MKISRTPLSMNSLAYSREWDVPRSAGVHLMSVVGYIAQEGGLEKKHTEKREDGSAINLDDFAIGGFLWEHVMSREEQLEHAMSVEAIRMDMQHRSNLSFPGEMFWCHGCDKVMKGRRLARKHCRRTGHRGIFSTPDAYDHVEHAYVEWKFTWKSSRRSVPAVLPSHRGIWRWPAQCAWNCMTLGTNKAYMIVCHVSGSYQKGMPKPEPYRIDIEFTDKEIRRYKNIIVTNAEEVGWL